MSKKSNTKPAFHPSTKLGKFVKGAGKATLSALAGPGYWAVEALKNIKKKRVESGMDKYKKGGYVKPKSKSKTWSNRANQYD